MNRVTALSATERQRILAIMGFDTWVRRDSSPLVMETCKETTATRNSLPSPHPAGLAVSKSDTRSVSIERNPSHPKNSAIQNHGSVLLVLENRIHADVPLIRALTTLLPGCTICTPETISTGVAKFAVQIGVEVTLPNDVLGLRTPTLAELRDSASARRALWWTIKPILRQLKM